MMACNIAYTCAMERNEFISCEVFLLLSLFETGGRCLNCRNETKRLSNKEIGTDHSAMERLVQAAHSFISPD